MQETSDAVFMFLFMMFKIVRVICGLMFFECVFFECVRVPPIFFFGYHSTIKLREPPLQFFQNHQQQVTEMRQWHYVKGQADGVG